MKLVHMDGLYDCGAAVLAMVLGLPSAKGVYPMLGYDPNEADSAGVGVSEEELTAVLSTCQIGYTRYMSLECMAEAHKVTAYSMRHRCKIPTEQELRCKLASRKGQAIVSVPKLGFSRHIPQHFVLVENNVILDPALRKRYLGDAYSLPVCSVLFIEKQLSDFVAKSGSTFKFSKESTGISIADRILEN